MSAAIRMAALGLGFVQAILTARLLGPEGYGVVAVALSVAAVVATLTMLGFGPLAVREVAQLSARSDWGRLRGFLRFSTLSVLAVSALAAAAIAIVALATSLVDPAFRGTIALAAPLVPMLALLAVLRGHCQGFGRVVAAQAPGELLRPAILVAALGLLLMAKSMAEDTVQPRTYILIAIGAAFAGVVAAAISLRQIIAAKVPAGSATTVGRRWSRSAAPFLALALLGILQGEANTLMLGGLAGPGEAGLFQPLARLAPVMAIAMQAVGIRYAPRVSELWARGDVARLRQITRLVTISTTLITAATCAAILVLAPWILGVFGKAFVANSGALGWIAAAQTLNVACGPVGLLLTMSGHQSGALRGHLCGLAVNVALGLWLIPEHGAHGAAQAMAGGIVAWNLVMLAGVRRRLGFDPSLLGLRAAPGGRGDSQ